jgi:hypothetical protein
MGVFTSDMREKTQTFGEDLTWSRYAIVGCERFESRRHSNE